MTLSAAGEQMRHDFLRNTHKRLPEPHGSTGLPCHLRIRILNGEFSRRIKDRAGRIPIIRPARNYPLNLGRVD
ncbi:MAG: hypothetical protein K2X60_00595 [Xanthobacteraceae bacterium]|nr:hypothetical protein [Xanthobacteraceae bacterium]